MQRFAKGCESLILSRFLFYALLCVAPYCAPGGVRVVSGASLMSGSSYEDGALYTVSCNEVAYSMMGS